MSIAEDVLNGELTKAKSDMVSIQAQCRDDIQKGERAARRVRDAQQVVDELKQALTTLDVAKLRDRVTTS